MPPTHQEQDPLFPDLPPRAFHVDDSMFTPPPVPLDMLHIGLAGAAGTAFEDMNSERQRARKKRLWQMTMSALGRCERQSALRLAGVEPTDPRSAFGQAREAQLGNMIHEVYLPYLLKKLNRAEGEKPVRLVVPVDTGTVTIGGRTDCYTRTAGGGVIDLKTVPAYKVGARVHEEGDDGDWWQVMGYSTGLWQMELPVSWMALLYMDRSTGETGFVLRRFDRSVVEAVYEKVNELWEYAGDPDSAPRGYRGPSLDWQCDVCPWLKACFGPDAEPGQASVLQTHDDEQRLMAAREYTELRDTVRPIEKRMEALSQIIGRARAGRYEGPDEAFTVTYSKNGETLDKKEAIRILEENDLPVPMLPVMGRRYVRRTTPTEAKESTWNRQDEE